MAGDAWSDQENDATVADYFAMLGIELRGDQLNKAAHRRALAQMVSRPDKAIEFKHQNISAVLLGMGLPWIDGYKPLSNYQHSLEDAVARFLKRQPAWQNGDVPAQRITSVREQPMLWIGPPPTHSNAPPQVDLEKMAAVAQKYDVAERDARNRALGRRGEQIVLDHERAALEAAGRDDLMRRVRWVADEDGDGAGFDIASFEPDGTERLIEVKATNGWERTPFHLTRNEIAVADARRDVWHLVRLWNCAREPRAFALRPPLSAHVQLTPTSFLAALH